MNKLRNPVLNPRNFRSTRVTHVAVDNDEVTEETTELMRKLISQRQAEKKKQVTLTSMHRAFVQSMNTYAVVLVLLATVTYSGFLHPPGSSDADLQTSSNGRLTEFVYFNSLSFFFTVADLVLCLSGSFSFIDLHAQIHDYPLERAEADIQQIQKDKELPQRIETAEASDVSTDTLASWGKVPESLFVEQAITHKLAKLVASTLFKLVCINCLFAVSLTCCVAAFVSAGFAVVRPKVPVIITSVLGCLVYLAIMTWLLNSSLKFFWRAGFSLTTLTSSLAKSAGHPRTQLQYREPPSAASADTMDSINLDTNTRSVRAETKGKIHHSTTPQLCAIGPRAPKWT